MSAPNTLPWHELSESAQQAVADIVVMLANRFTGRIEMECIEGGVREFRESVSRRSGDLGSRSREAKP